MHGKQAQEPLLSARITFRLGRLYISFSTCTVFFGKIMSITCRTHQEIASHRIYRSDREKELSFREVNPYSL